MKNKGFTLVELLAVIALIVLIFMLVYPSVANILSKSEETVYQKQINTILNAAYDFSLKNISYLPENDQKSYITLGQLKYEGLIDVDIKDPSTNDFFVDNLVVSIHNVGSGYKYSDENSKLEGDYLYTVEIKKYINPSLLPTITLEGLTRNSDGNYILNLDLNEKFNLVNYKADSSTGVDLTSRVNKYILMNDVAVDTIDSSKSGIYKINYSVVDDNGYANITTLNVIIADSILPIINLPQKNTISKDATTFDLLSDVTCEDNSGFCELTHSGEIDFGVIGKYIIEYTAQDPNGNTSTKKRVITIE